MLSERDGIAILPTGYGKTLIAKSIDTVSGAISRFIELMGDDVALVFLPSVLYRSGQLQGFPSGKHFDDGDQAYQMSFWSLAHRATGGGYFQVPFMSGAGGNTVFLAPNGVTTFVFTDHGTDTYSLDSPMIAETMSSLRSTRKRRRGAEVGLSS